MPVPISLAGLADLPPATVLIDVRRAPARKASGRTIPLALRGEPGRVADWGPALEGRTVVVFCVHGHEVSQGVADHLTRFGIETYYLDGGFAAWEAQGNPVEPIGADE